MVAGMKGTTIRRQFNCWKSVIRSEPYQKSA